MRAIRLSEKDLTEACKLGLPARIGRRVDPSSDREIVALPAQYVMSDFDGLGRVSLLEPINQLKGGLEVFVLRPLSHRAIAIPSAIHVSRA